MNTQHKIDDVLRVLLSFSESEREELRRKLENALYEQKLLRRLKRSKQRKNLIKVDPNTLQPLF